MARPASVTAATVVVFLGCAFTAFMGFAMIAVALGGGATSQLPARFGIGVGLMFFALSVLGVVVGTAVLKLREWARIAMLIFAGGMAVFSAFGTVLVMIVPMPQTPAGIGMARAIIAAVYAVPLLVGVWWLVLFTRRNVVAAFAEASPGEVSTRPLAVTIIAYWSIASGVGVLLTSTMGMPAFVVGFVIYGWAGSAVYVFLGAINIYAGLGLLKLLERARVLAMTLFGLAIVQSGIMLASPTARARMIEAQKAMAPPDLPASTGPDPALMSMWFMGVAALVALVGIWLLARAKPAFK